jgi:Acetyltransferase (GNAT) domain
MVYKKQNLKPPLPKEFFERVFKLIREKDIGYMLVCENQNEEAVAAHLNLYGKKSTVTWSTVRNPSFSQRGPNTLLYYNDILDLKCRDFEYMNVMSANVPRFMDFIKSFSPKLVPYYSVTLRSKKYSIMKNLYEFVTETAVYQKFCK